MSILLLASVVNIINKVTHIQGTIQPEEYASTDCIASAVAATEPMGLEFCHWYNTKSCCIPASDEENLEMFTNLMDLGLSCSHAKHSVRTTYQRIREWYCLSCDPSEPLYRFKTAVGSPKNGIAPITDSESYFTWRVCKSFTDTLWNGEESHEFPTAGSQYNKCGIKIQNPCDGQKQVVYSNGKEVLTDTPVLGGWDAYMCGDGILIPSKAFKGSTAAKDFMTLLEPPNFGDVSFKFVIVNDMVSDNECRSCQPNLTSKLCLNCNPSCVFYDGSCIGFTQSVTPCFGYSKSSVILPSLFMITVSLSLLLFFS